MKQRGFTLIELLVVIAIIGVLSTIILSSLGSAREKAKMARYVSDMEMIKKALQMAMLDEDRDTWWIEGIDFNNNPSINSLLTIHSGPGHTISKYLPNKNWVDPFTHHPYIYDADGDNNDACDLYKKGVNIYFVGASSSLKQKLDKYVDHEINPNCGKIKYSNIVLLYELSSNPNRL